jgi:3-hydroxy-3-methylglutaryl CoA synthase
VAKSPLFRAAFARTVAPALGFAPHVGNVYSASMYLALACLLERAGQESLAGHRVTLASYGSGASAKVLSGIVDERYGSAIGSLRVAKELHSEAEGGPRVPLSMSDYERLHNLADCELDGDESVVQKLRDGLALNASEVMALRAVWAKPAWRVRPRAASVRPPREEFALDHLGTSSTPLRTDVGYRYYKWVP